MRQLTTDWIDKNIKKMMDDIMVDARNQKPLPTKITMHSVALNKFIAILASKSIFFPDPDGTFKFLNIKVRVNNFLPFGTFAVERFSGVNTLSRKI